MGCVYLAKNLINGKCYVGKTIRALEVRRYAHEWEAAHGSYLHFHLALRKHGFDAFAWTELYVSADEEMLYAQEIVHIKQLGTIAPAGYNITAGGRGVVGHKPTKKQRRAVSRRHKGVPLSAEHRQKIARALKGKQRSASHCAAISAAKKGRTSFKHTPESRAKISAANSRRWEAYRAQKD